MQSKENVMEAARLWLEIADRSYDPRAGLPWVPAVHAVQEGSARERDQRHYPVAQDGLSYVQALLALDIRLQDARRGLEAVLSCQIADADSHDYGNYRWYYEDENVRDVNAGFFVNLDLLSIYFRYKERLGDPLSMLLLKSFQHSLADLARPATRVGYTNRLLGRAACGALIAEMIRDQECVKTVRDNLELFYLRNFSEGIPERLSTCYYGVNLTALALLLRHVKDPRIRRIARETMDVMLQELSFFGARHPIPACRTYNAHGEGLNYMWIAWVLGLNPLTPQDLKRRGWLHGSILSSWLALSDAGVSAGPQPQPAPRLLRGRFAENGSTYAYFHPDFTLGCFTRYPGDAIAVPDAHDIPAGFSGDGSNLGILGIAAQRLDRTWTALPVRHELHDNPEDLPDLGRSFPMQPSFIAHQHENILIWLVDVDRFDADLRSFGAVVRVPQFLGRALDYAGHPLEGVGGRLKHGWVFLITDDARFGIYPLTRLRNDPRRCEYGPVVWHRLPDPVAAPPYPAPWHICSPADEVESVPPDARPFGLYFPNFESDPPRQLRRDNVSNGVVIVAGGRAQLPEAFMNHCRRLTIADEWTIDAYTSRAGWSEGERLVEVKADDFKMRLRYDYKSNRVIERSVNGVPTREPSTLAAVQFLSPNKV